MWRYLLLALALGASSTGCGSDDGSSGHDSGHEHVEEGEHDHYVAGMSRTSEAGAFDVSFRSEPGPPAMGLNVFTLGIALPDGTPATGADVEVTPSMPSHGHGSDRTPSVSETAPGVYRVENVSLQMMGIWEIAIDITADGTTDSVAFRFEIQ